VEEMSVAGVAPAWKRAEEQVAVARGKRLPFCARHLPQKRWRIRPGRAWRIGSGSVRDKRERWRLWVRGAPRRPRRKPGRGRRFLAQSRRWSPAVPEERFLSAQADRL